MRHVDFSPLYRSTVGFDRLFGMLDTLGQPENGQTYPPYNIERTGEDSYRISMAVAGFSDADISIEAHRNVLTVKGERKDEPNGEGSELLYRGIASRAFVVGDLASDVELGRAVGATTLLVRTGHGAATLAHGEVRPDHVVPDLAAAAERIEGLLGGEEGPSSGRP